jgi:predicted DNA-binding helix-hairpin-helix protein
MKALLLVLAALACGRIIAAGAEDHSPTSGSKLIGVAEAQKQMKELIEPLQIAASFIREHRRPCDPPAGASPTAWVGSQIRSRIGSRTGLEKTRGMSEFGHGRLGISTQFVVGPAGESDRELLEAGERLYRQMSLARAYYSAFNPVAGTPFEDEPPTDPRREFRLYQADWLLRYYGFSVQELRFDALGQLDQAVDPKTAWAEAHPERFPVEVNRAPLPELLRVPGIGPVSGRAIIAARQHSALRELGDLRRLGVHVARASPYVLLAGNRPWRQLLLL